LPVEIEETKTEIHSARRSTQSFKMEKKKPDIKQIKN